MPAENITDYRVLAAVAHPVRRRLLDVLRVEQAASVGVLADRLGVAVGSVSHHAKVLAGHGLIVEAPELARDARERWWRLGDARISWSNRAFADDPAGSVVAQAVDELSLRLQLERLTAWRAANAEAAPAWQDAATSTDMWLRLTPDELAQVSGELTELLSRWRTRELPDDEPREPVFVFAHAFPSNP